MSFDLQTNGLLYSTRSGAAETPVELYKRVENILLKWALTAVVACGGDPWKIAGEIPLIYKTKDALHGAVKDTVNNCGYQERIRLSRESLAIPLRQNQISFVVCDLNERFLSRGVSTDGYLRVLHLTEENGALCVSGLGVAQSSWGSSADVLENVKRAVTQDLCFRERPVKGVKPPEKDSEISAQLIQKINDAVTMAATKASMNCTDHFEWRNTRGFDVVAAGVGAALLGPVGLLFGDTSESRSVYTGCTVSYSQQIGKKITNPFVVANESILTEMEKQHPAAAKILREAIEIQTWQGMSGQREVSFRTMRRSDIGHIADRPRILSNREYDTTVEQERRANNRERRKARIQRIIARVANKFG